MKPRDTLQGRGLVKAACLIREGTQLPRTQFLLTQNHWQGQPVPPHPGLLPQALGRYTCQRSSPKGPLCVSDVTPAGGQAVVGPHPPTGLPNRSSPGPRKWRAPQFHLLGTQHQLSSLTGCERRECGGGGLGNRWECWRATVEGRAPSHLQQDRQGLMLSSDQSQWKK